MKRPYYLFSNGRLCRRQNTLCLERATDARNPGTEAARPMGDGAPPETESASDTAAPANGSDGAATEETNPVEAASLQVDDDGTPTGTLTGEKVPFPIESAESIYCFGEIDVNSKLVSFLSQHHVPLFFFDYYGNYRASLYPKEHLLSGRLTVAQVEHHTDAQKRLRLARAFVTAAAANMRRVLKYYTTRLDGEAADTVASAVAAIEDRERELPAAEETDTLMGLEGQMRAAYYRAWPALLGEAGADFPYERRSRQPPSNALNALISFGNSMCYSVAVRQLYHTALDPTISYLHEPGDRRFSLALDLAEVFKPLLVDRAIFRLVKTRQIQPDDFEDRLGGVYLTESGRKTFVSHWDERLQQTIEHRTLRRKVSYGRLVRLEAYRLVRHLCDPENDPYEGFEIWW
jgi:CRISPR-associated protein Cas1